jgi:hypothetical protein
MAITAKFIADFDDFVPSTKKAEVALVELEGAAARVTPSVTNMRTAMGSFDGVLSSMGVNLSPQIRALGELGDAAGKTASQLGLIATTGLVVGAAMGGWKIGRAVAEFFELDTAIADATAALLGWGDVAGEVAGANADVLARASKAAGMEITDMALALALLEPPAKASKAELKALADQTKALADADKAAADVMHASNERKLKDHQTMIDAMAPFKAAMVELNSVGEGWRGTLDTIDGTVVEAIKSYLQAGVSLNALATAYGLTDAQVKAVSSSLREDTEAQKRRTEARQNETRALEDQRGAEARLSAEKKAAKKITDDLAAAEAARRAANRAMGNATQFDLSTEAGRAKVPESIATWLKAGYSLEQATQIDFLTRWGLPINANDPLFRNKGPRVPGFAGGVENFGGGLAMVGERGPELVNLPPGSDVLPLGRGGGSIVNHFYLVDNSENIARKVSALIIQSTLRGGPLRP